MSKFGYLNNLQIILKIINITALKKLRWKVNQKQKVEHLQRSLVGGWMSGWNGVKAGLRIAYSNKK